MKCTISFRPRKDQDLIDLLKSLPHGDRSWFLRELVRDGLKYREIQKQGMQRNTHLITPTSLQEFEKSAFKDQTDFSNIPIYKREVDDNELDNKMDKL